MYQNGKRFNRTAIISFSNPLQPNYKYKSITQLVTFHPINKDIKFHKFIDGENLYKIPMLLRFINIK